jgi:hypothetical protein
MTTSLADWARTVSPGTTKNSSATAATKRRRSLKSGNKILGIKSIILNENSQKCGEDEIRCHQYSSGWLLDASGAKVGDCLLWMAEYIQKESARGAQADSD